MRAATNQIKQGRLKYQTLIDLVFNMKPLIYKRLQIIGFMIVVWAIISNMWISTSVALVNPILWVAAIYVVSWLVVIIRHPINISTSHRWLYICFSLFALIMLMLALGYGKFIAQPKAERLYDEYKAKPSEQIR